MFYLLILAFDKICKLVPQDHLVAKPFGFSLLDRHIKDIHDHWLSDEVIDAFLIAIQKESLVSLLTGVVLLLKEK